MPLGGTSPDPTLLAVSSSCSERPKCAVLPLARHYPQANLDLREKAKVYTTGQKSALSLTKVVALCCFRLRK
jgi:hypothetical protein